MISKKKTKASAPEVSAATETKMKEPIGSGKIKEGIKDFLKAVWTGVGPDKKARHVAKQYIECEFMCFILNYFFF
jgi:hypothetical protein